jgi:hypothetical protein
MLNAVHHCEPASIAMSMQLFQGLTHMHTYSKAPTSPLGQHTSYTLCPIACCSCLLLTPLYTLVQSLSDRNIVNTHLQQVPHVAVHHVTVSWLQLQTQCRAATATPTVEPIAKQPPPPTSSCYPCLLLISLCILCYQIIV